mgnify:CR=1 FL=1
MEYLDRVLRHLMSGMALPLPRTDGPLATDPFALALRSLLQSWHGEFAAGAQTAAHAMTVADDPDARALARAAAGFAMGMWPPAASDPTLREPRTGADPVAAALADEEPISPAMYAPTTALLAESALANARVTTAAAFLARMGDPPDTLFGGRHPFLTFIRALAARVAVYQGDITGAERWADAAVGGAEGETESLFALACVALARGSADRRAATRELVEQVSAAPVPVDAVTRGCFVLAAYGARALGLETRGARLILLAGGDDDLGGLRIIDRAFGLESLVAAAISMGDLDAAGSWLSRLEVLAGHRIAEPTVQRARCRMSITLGDAGGALASADRAVLLARADGRMIEAAEAEILRARAHIAHRRGGAAERELSVLVTESEARGYFAIRRFAARELRQVGRRLPPIAASGWQGLSPRERDVALLIAQGRSNASLARELFLSAHTVRRHVSRVLAAFAVGTRAGVAAALTDSAAGRPMSGTVATLTGRQRAVAELIRHGSTNRRIAEVLGIGTTTVEKHVSAIKDRWNITSRAEIAVLASWLADAG